MAFCCYTICLNVSYISLIRKAVKCLRTLGKYRKAYSLGKYSINREQISDHQEQINWKPKDVLPVDCFWGHLWQKVVQHLQAEMFFLSWMCFAVFDWDFLYTWRGFCQCRGCEQLCECNPGTASPEVFPFKVWALQQEYPFGILHCKC